MAERFGNDLILLERIAAGGMAEVYRAKQLGYSGFEKTIAVKRILPNYASNEEFKEMFRAEANLTGLLQHQNIVQIFGNGQWEDYLFLTMEFVDGKNVRQLLARADKKKLRIPIEFSLYVIAEAAKGLEYAHNFVDERTGESLEIVHRDMSPQNIMLSYDGAVKIVDFGIAKAASKSGSTRAGVLKGKFGYMSPEQAQGMALDKRTDIFALGIILFELLTQRRLFTADDDLRTLQLVKDCRVPRPSKYNPDVSPTLDNIVLKALKKEKAERYNSASELYAELIRYINQKYPKFLPTDLTKFICDLFAEDRVEERKKRDKANAEMSAKDLQLTGKGKDFGSTPLGKADDKAFDRSSEESGKTSVSGIGTPTQGSNSISSSINMNGGDRLTKGEGTQKTEIATDSTPSLPEPKSTSMALARSEIVSLESGAPLGVVKTGYDPDLLKSTLKRPVKMAPSSNRRVGTMGAVAGLVLVAALGWLYSGSGGGDVNPTKPTPNPDRPPASCSNPDWIIPPGGKECVDSKTYCGNGRAWSSEKGDCIEVAVQPKQCPQGQKLNTSTDQCEVISVTCTAPEVLDASTNTCKRPAPQPMVQAENVWVLTDEPVSNSGVLNLSSTPQGDSVTINGRQLVDKNLKPLKTPILKIRLKPGAYRVKIKNDFWGQSREQTINIEADRISDVDLLLK